MKRLGVLLAVICFLTMAFGPSQKVVKKADKEISKFFEIEGFKKEAILISDAMNAETSANFGNENLFKIVSEGNLLGYGYIGNAPSKTATFDYLVLFDTEWIILKSKVLIYREEYGGEIGSKRWLRQFEGASTATSELKYNDDIIPISGATISVRSMTLAINNLLQGLSQLQALKAI